MELIQRFNQIKSALRIKRTLGVRCAAGFLRNRDFSLEEALMTLGFPVRGL